MRIANNVTRWLDSHAIPYTSFELTPEKHGALETARLLGVHPEIVFKTIVVVRAEPSRASSEGAPKGKPLLVIVPAAATVDLKALAAVLGEKKLSLPTEREAERLTGLRAGGISPLALLNRGFAVVIDSSSQRHPEIHVSGGQRGLNIRLAVEDLVRVTGATVASVARSDH